jgi:hypothetical protein
LLAAVAWQKQKITCALIMVSYGENVQISEIVIVICSYELLAFSIPTYESKACVHSLTDKLERISYGIFATAFTIYLQVAYCL